jgi:regulator of telomere elongation helicase 1
LDNRENGLFQSPTGTGKTLSLLTGALAFLQKKRNMGQLKSSSIIYLTRTHTQIKQLVKELKSTCYKPTVAVLGSRDQLCVNAELEGKFGVEKNVACQNLCNSGACRYMKMLQKKKLRIVADASEKIMDIEELAAAGRAGGFCSYFMSKQMTAKADIIFMPYNYITDPMYRSIVREEIKGAILIFDEAHNLDHFAEEGSSFT